MHPHLRVIFTFLIYLWGKCKNRILAIILAVQFQDFTIYDGKWSYNLEAVLSWTDMGGKLTILNDWLDTSPDIPFQIHLSLSHWLLEQIVQNNNEHFAHLVEIYIKLSELAYV